MVAFPQGIVGDPGLPGRDGDPGIEVLYSAYYGFSVVNFRSSWIIISVVFSSQAYQGPQGLSGKLGRSGAKVTH